MTGGTGAYVFMAPEIFRHGPYNAKADVYSLAMVMYEMLSGRRPFAGMDPGPAAMRAATDDLRPEWPAEPPPRYTGAERAVLPGVQRLVQRCWAASPALRCGSSPRRLVPPNTAAGCCRQSCIQSRIFRFSYVLCAYVT